MLRGRTPVLAGWARRVTVRQAEFNQECKNAVSICVTAGDLRGRFKAYSPQWSIVTATSVFTVTKRTATSKNRPLGTVSLHLRVSTLLK